MPFAKVESRQRLARHRIHDFHGAAVQYRESLGVGREHQPRDAAAGHVTDELARQAVVEVPYAYRVVIRGARRNAAIGADREVTHLGSVAEKAQVVGPLAEPLAARIGRHDVHVAARVADDDA